MSVKLVKLKNCKKDYKTLKDHSSSSDPVPLSHLSACFLFFVSLVFQNTKKQDFLYYPTK